MRLKQKTIERVNFLKEATGTDNRTQITAEALALAAWWVESKQEGAKIYAEYPDGKRESVVIPGLEPINNHETERV